MANGQQKAEQNIVAFENWIASMSDDDFAQIVFRGQLNRGEVAKGIGCAKSALRQNPRMATMLAELEDNLRIRGVLPSPTIESKADKPLKYDQDASRRVRESNHLAKLEKENLELKAKIKVLETKLAKYTELSDVLGEFGVMPR